MGLDLSLAPADFDASIADEDEWEQNHKLYGYSRWHASYGGFHHFREGLAEFVGIELAAMVGHGGKDEWADVSDRARTLQPLLDHSDCDGELDYEGCKTCLPTLIEYRNSLTNPNDKWLLQSTDELITLFKECINLRGQVIFG